jgi:ribonucleoside-diphosphate reductase alpha chain
VQDIEEIPDDLKALYKTVWEISQKVIIDMAADRGAFICQSQSMNLFVENPNFGKLSSMHFYAWQKGLKTGMYYLRSKAATDPIKFTISQDLQKKRVSNKATATASATIPVKESQKNSAETSAEEGQACNLDDPDCLMCGA